MDEWKDVLATATANMGGGTMRTVCDDCYLSGWVVRNAKDIEAGLRLMALAKTAREVTLTGRYGLETIPANLDNLDDTMQTMRWRALAWRGETDDELRLSTSPWFNAPLEALRALDGEEQDG